ncbi:MAG: choice-of-anchor J domain-containing protein [Caldilineaceae bacterium]|nr:choice-of-anchor J domain-containing protein [Caldilineaceae bacterium]
MKRLALSTRPVTFAHSAAHRPRVWFCAVVMSTLLSVGLQAQAQAASCTNLVVDSGLETGAGWVTQSSSNYPLLSNRLTHTGKQAAYLAGTNQAQDLLATTITVPAKPTTLTLTFWWQIQSQESGRYQDSLAVMLSDAQGKTPQLLTTLSSREMSNQWQQRTITLVGVANQTVQLQFLAYTDAEAATDFFLDDIEVVACQ